MLWLSRRLFFGGEDAFCAALVSMGSTCDPRLLMEDVDPDLSAQVTLSRTLDFICEENPQLATAILDLHYTILNEHCLSYYRKISRLGILIFSAFFVFAIFMGYDFQSVYWLQVSGFLVSVLFTILLCWKGTYIRNSSLGLLLLGIIILLLTLAEIGNKAEGFTQPTAIEMSLVCQVSLGSSGGEPLMHVLAIVLLGAFYAVSITVLYKSNAFAGIIATMTMSFVVIYALQQKEQFRRSMLINYRSNSCLRMRAEREEKLKLQMQTDAAAAQREAQFRFMSVISHEIRSPLSAVTSFLEVIEAEEGLPPHVKKVMGPLSVSTQMVQELVEQVMQYTSMGVVDPTLTNTVFSLEVWLDNAASILGTSAAKMDVQLICMPDCSIRGVVLNGDKGRLLQILTNLVTNAIKFTRDWVKLDVRIDTGETERRSDDSTVKDFSNSMSEAVDGFLVANEVMLDVEEGRGKVNIVICVTDNGNGIAAEDISKIFAPYEQVHTDDLRGVGLGLAISFRLAQLFGGNITATSAVGEGSSFTVTVPMALGGGPPELGGHNLSNRLFLASPALEGVEELSNERTEFSENAILGMLEEVSTSAFSEDDERDISPEMIALRAANDVDALTCWRSHSTPNLAYL